MFKINFCENKKRNLKKFKYYYGPKQLNNSIKNSNCLINLLPNTSSTSQIINLQLLKLLNTEAYFINIGRGNTVNESDLIYSLEKKIINGAILDVFNKEPLNKNNKLYNISNVFISPHIAGITKPTDYAVNTLIRNIQSLNTNNKIKNKISIKKEY